MNVRYVYEPGIPGRYLEEERINVIVDGVFWCSVWWFAHLNYWNFSNGPKVKTLNEIPAVVRAELALRELANLS